MVMALLLVCCLAFSGILARQPSYHSVWMESPRKIVLDAGHGGIDGGAQGASGLLEKDVNLSVVQKCELLCALLGIQTTLTRNSDASIDDGTGATIAARKADDIRRRVSIANSSSGILLSIHMNSFTDPRYWGAQCFYSKNHPDGSILAECMQNTLHTLNLQNNRTAKVAEDSIYLMKHVQVPALIVECGFLSNPEEELQLADDGYRKQLAMAICTGALMYYTVQR